MPITSIPYCVSRLQFSFLDLLLALFLLISEPNAILANKLQRFATRATIGNRHTYLAMTINTGYVASGIPPTAKFNLILFDPLFDKAQPRHFHWTPYYLGWTRLKQDLRFPF